MPARKTAAARYKPKRSLILFVAESPPQSDDRYFYFENVKGHDWLWIALMKAVYPSQFGATKDERRRKRMWLSKFQESGFQLIDAVKEPLRGTHRRRVLRIKASAPTLISEIQAISPNQIVLIKKSVHDALCQVLKEAGFPVVNQEALPFPAAGQQTKFQKAFRRLSDSGKLSLYSY